MLCWVSQAFKISMVADTWVYVDGIVEEPATREDVLLILSDVNSILIKATRLNDNSPPSIG